MKGERMMTIDEAIDKALKQKHEYKITCVAMAIVNFTNEINGVDVITRQANNDKCFDFAIEKIKEGYERV